MNTLPPHIRIRTSVPAFCMACVLATGSVLAQTTEPPDPEADGDAVQNSTILDNAGNRQTGIFHLNQSSADVAQQGNTLSASVVVGSGAAVADATSSQQSRDNILPPSMDASATMTGVANETTGLVAINQSTGGPSGQANLAAIAIANGPQGFASAAATGSSGAARNGLTFDTGQFDASMDNIGNGSVGAIQINQAAGNGTQQNIIALAAAQNGIALADVIGPTRDGGDESDPPNGAYPASAGQIGLSGSFNNMSGIAQVNQAVGGDNMQSNLLAAAFGQFADASILTDTSLGSVHAPADSQGNAQPGDSDASTALAGSFDGFSGVGQVSQVSGYGNSTVNSIAVTITHIPGAGL